MSRTDPSRAERPGALLYAGEWICQDCDYAEYRVTAGATGNVVRCPVCGGNLVHPQDTMA
jgi:rubrerythrin